MTAQLMTSEEDVGPHCDAGERNPRPVVLGFSPMLAGVLIIALGESLFGAGYTLWFALAGVVAAVGGALVFRIRGGR